MTDKIDEILATLNKDARPWFKKAVEKEAFPLNWIVERLEKQGYVLDGSGLMRRNILTEEEIKKAGHTILDLAFIRPSTYHCHTDVAELAKIIDGEGAYIQNTQKGAYTPVENGQLIYTPIREPHGWLPKKGHYLAIHLICSGILNLEREQQLLSFQELETYLTKYLPALRGDNI
jgi:mannose-6-phosphate isomerase-like protein (cupin superfamily)